MGDQRRPEGRTPADQGGFIVPLAAIRTTEDLVRALAAAEAHHEGGACDLLCAWARERDERRRARMAG